MPPIIKPSHKATISLEAALVMVPCLLIVVTFLFLLYARLIALQLSLALENTAEELAVLFPLCEQGERRLPEAMRQKLREIFPDQEAESLQQLAGDYALSSVLGPFMEKRIDYWLQRFRASGSLPVKAHERQLVCEWQGGHHALVLNLYCQTDTLFGIFEQKIVSIVPIWTDRLEDSSEEDETEDDDTTRDDIWSRDNFTRGHFFREKAGANLPFNFPVLAYYRQGIAKSIRSMDLTAPSYRRPEQAQKSLLQDLNRLQAFNSYPSRGKHLPTIKPGDITDKIYVLIVPENMPDVYVSEFFAEMAREADARGISLQVERYGRSHRYDDIDGNEG